MSVQDHDLVSPGHYTTSSIHLERFVEQLDGPLGAR